MRIGELAGATGATVRALRHYEQARLISSRRAPNGYRVYAASAVVRVRNIRFLLTAGLTLDDVRVFLPCLDGDMTAGPPSPRALRVAADRLAVLDERIAAQTAVRDRLAAALREAAVPDAAAHTAAAGQAADGGAGGDDTGPATVGDGRVDDGGDGDGGGRGSAPAPSTPLRHNRTAR